jgi:hypothetical protein
LRTGSISRRRSILSESRSSCLAFSSVLTIKSLPLIALYGDSASPLRARMLDLAAPASFPRPIAGTKTLRKETQYHGIVDDVKGSTCGLEKPRRPTAQNARTPTAAIPTACLPHDTQLLVHPTYAASRAGRPK